MHVGIERGLHRRDDPVASRLIHLAQDPGEGTEAREVTDQLLFGKRADNVDRPDVDLGPAALLEDGVDAEAVREGELSRRVRPAWREVR